MQINPTKLRMEINRYITVCYIYHRSLSEKEIWFIFSNTINQLFGLQGSLEMGLYLSWVNPSPEEPMAIFRCSHNKLQNFMAATYWIREFREYPIVFIPIKTHGTIKTAKDSYLNQKMNNKIKKLTSRS
jgi:RNase P/RNase MRP subunit POP5